MATKPTKKRKRTNTDNYTLCEKIIEAAKRVRDAGGGHIRFTREYKE